MTMAELQLTQTQTAALKQLQAEETLRWSQFKDREAAMDDLTERMKGV